VIFRRRFADVISRQLDVFAQDESALLSEVREAEQAYNRAERAEAEEKYGDYVDVVETATEALADMRDRFGRTLDDSTAEEYEAAFNRAVKRRWPPFGLEIENR
jgi:tRNA G10  N-methylase Trm11